MKNANPTDYQDFSSTQVNNFLRYNHWRFPLHVPDNKNDLFRRTTLIWRHFGKKKSVRTATNEITGPQENSVSCEMMFSDHLNETDEKAVYKRRLSPCMRAMCTSAEFKVSVCKFPDLGCVCWDTLIKLVICWYV